MAGGAFLSLASLRRDNTPGSSGTHGLPSPSAAGGKGVPVPSSTADCDCPMIVGLGVSSHSTAALGSSFVPSAANSDAPGRRWWGISARRSKGSATGCSWPEGIGRQSTRRAEGNDSLCSANRAAPASVACGSTAKSSDHAGSLRGSSAVPPASAADDASSTVCWAGVRPPSAGAFSRDATLCEQPQQSSSPTHQHFHPRAGPGRSFMASL